MNFDHVTDTINPVTLTGLTLGGTSHVVLPAGPTSSRPASPTLGATRTNTTTNNLEYWNGTTWIQFTATGINNAPTFVYPNNTPTEWWETNSGQATGFSMSNSNYSANATYVPPVANGTLAGQIPAAQWYTAATTFSQAGLYATAPTVFQGTGSVGGYVYECAFTMPAGKYVNNTTGMFGVTANGFNYGSTATSNSGIYLGWEDTQTSTGFLTLFTCDGTSVTRVATSIPLNAAFSVYMRIVALPGQSPTITAINLLTGATIYSNLALTSTIPAATTLVGSVESVGNSGVAAAVYVNIHFMKLTPYYTYASLSNTSIGGSTGTGALTRVSANISSNTTAGSAAGTDYVYLVSGNTTLTLPSAVGNSNIYTIKNVDGNTTTVATTSSQTIDGSTTALITQRYTSINVISDGANWNII